MRDDVRDDLRDENTNFSLYKGLSEDSCEG